MNANTERAYVAPEPASGGRRWPFGPVRSMLVVTCVLSGLFLLFPSVDLWFSGLFYDEATGFRPSRVSVFQWVRQLCDAIIWTIAIASILSVLAKLILPERRSLIAPRTSLFLISTLALGPGLLVNGILKDHWGRPRPNAIVEFGGDLPFVCVWRITNFCDQNCSFVSGEASAAIWLLTLALVVPIAWRNRVAVMTMILAALFSLSRVVTGSHFVSDLLISWALTLLVVAVAHHFLFVQPLPGMTAAELEEKATRASRALRRTLRLRRAPD